MVNQRCLGRGTFVIAMGLTRTVVFAILAACGSQASQSAGTGDTSAAAEAAAPAPKTTFTEVYDQVLNGSCLGCHSGIVGQFSGLDLSTRATAYANTVNQTASRCSGQTLVMPGHAETSLLYLKLTSPPCGSLMPPNGASLPQSSIDLVKTWIDEGAPND
jgi:hypothetical protein